MQGEGILQTIAELAVAFTGFTGVVAVFGRRADEPWAPLELFRFRVLLGASLAALLFSLLPFVMHYAGASARTTWALGSGLVALHLAAVALLDARYLLRVAPGKDRAPRYPGEIVVGAVALGVVAVQLLNVVGLLGGGSFAGYLVALVYYLFVAALNFVRLLAREGVGA